MKLNQLFQSVTDSIIRQLEEGVAPWVQPWKTTRNNGVGLLPVNVATGRSYSGINIPILWHAAEQCGYSTHGWLTYRQAQAQNAHVRKGEKATTVVFTKTLTIEEDEAEKLIRMLRTFRVFNVDQVEGLEKPEPPTTTLEERHESAQAFIEATRAAINYGGSRACYVPSKDMIFLPPSQAFKDQGSFYATSLHELGHWTGSKPRLDRDLTGRFGDQSYCAEELIAELTAAFLCAKLDITGELRHAEYIDHWLNLLRGDNRAIFTAAAKAQQAADYLSSFSPST